MKHSTMAFDLQLNLDMDEIGEDLNISEDALDEIIEHHKGSIRGEFECEVEHALRELLGRGIAEYVGEAPSGTLGEHLRIECGACGHGVLPLAVIGGTEDSPEVVCLGCGARLHVPTETTTLQVVGAAVAASEEPH